MRHDVKSMKIAITLPKINLFDQFFSFITETLRHKISLTKLEFLPATTFIVKNPIENTSLNSESHLENRLDL